MTSFDSNSFAANTDWFVGIDSDGCAFDTMEVKHKECFIPATINHYGLQPVSKFAREAAEFVNLYSTSRGINRFPALIQTLELLAVRPEVIARGIRVTVPEGLVSWIQRETKLANPALEKAVAERGDPDLAQALGWSREVNSVIERVVHGVPPFPLVRESLEALSGKADVLVVSATPGEALEREWYEPDFASHRLQYKHRIGRTTPSVFLVGILHHVHPVFGHRTISGRVINEFELAVSDIVVNCFGNANSNQIHPTLSRLLAHLVRGIHRIIAADVEKVADIVSGHHIKRAIEILLLMIFEFVTASADRSSAGSRSQECNFGGVLTRQVEQLLFEHPLNTVTSTVDGADLIEISRSLDNATKGVIDNRTRAAALSNDHRAWM